MWMSYFYRNMPNTSDVIFSTWFLAIQDYRWYCTRYYPTLDMLYLMYDLWHWHLICYIWYLIHGTLYLTPVLDMLYLIPDPRHLILDIGTWYMSYMSPDPDPRIWHMLTLTWYAFMWHKYINLTSWPLTGHYHPWYLYYMAYSWLSLLRGLDYYIVTRHLILLNSCTPVFLNPWKRVTPDTILLLVPVIG